MAFDGGPDHANGARAFRWSRHEEPVVYVAAAVSYVGLGVALQTLVLNWIVGPLYFVVFVWASSSILERRRRHR